MFDTKLLKPQNILGMLHNGSRDLGFAGDDWRQELGLDVVEVLDTGLDPVRIVAAAPNPRVLEDRVGFEGRARLIVASEYPGITRRWMEEKGLDAEYLRAYGATESLPPEDADLIVDNTATGSTLRANGLTILETITSSTTRLFASKAAMENPVKRAGIEAFATVLNSVLEARRKLLLAYNVKKEQLEESLAVLSDVRAPTVAPLHGEGTGFAVQAVVSAKDVPSLLVSLKASGAFDIIVQSLKQVVH